MPVPEEGLPSDQPLSMPSIVVYKARRVLELWDGARLVFRFPVGLGSAPEGKKGREGDGRTPEGMYAVCTRNPSSRYHLSLGISYPNAEDARRGREQGLIGGAEYDIIVRATTDGKCPPWNTALGGEICIHGGGADRDWTAGCIALGNGDMDALWARCPLGTKVTIYH